MSNTLSCPACGHPTTHVTNSRGNSTHGPSIYRTRACGKCKHRFYTVEIERPEGFADMLALAGRIGGLDDDRRRLVGELVEMLS